MIFKLLTILIVGMTIFSVIKFYWFILFCLVVEIIVTCLLFVNFVKKTYSHIPTLTEDEAKTLLKYSFYFSFPRTSRSISTSLSLIALFSIVISVYYFFNKLWIYGLLIAANYFLAQFLSVKFNVRFYLHDRVKNNSDTKYKKEMDIVDSLCNKLIESGKYKNK